MTTWFITRHPGARDWAEREALKIDRYCAHLDPQDVQAGDTAFGFDQYFAFDLATQDDDPPCLVPGGEFEFCFYPLKTFANVLPVLTGPVAFDELFDPTGLAQFEEVGLRHVFQGGHDRFVAKGVVAPYQSGALFWREGMQQVNQTRQAVFGGGGVAGLDFGIQAVTRASPMLSRRA